MVILLAALSKISHNVSLLLFTGPDANPNGVKFTDHKVCKSFLYGCCPHEILASTVSPSKILIL
jgi:hypothetical protein